MPKLKEAARRLASHMGREAWSRMPRKAQVALAQTYQVAMTVEHGLQGMYDRGQALARQVARERGLPEEYVQRVGRLLAATDAIGKWTVNVPGLHEVLSLTGVGGVAGFLTAKAGYYVPVASLAYVGYSTARDPFATIRAAQGVVPQGRHGSRGEVRHDGPEGGRDTVQGLRRTC